MRLSKRTEYGLRAVVQLARLWPQHFVQSRDLARQESLPTKFLESILLALLGRVAGCLLGMLLVKLALSGVTGTTNFATFSEVVFAFQLTPALLLTGIVFSLVMGFFGGLFPAGRAAFTKITQALRQVG